MKPRRTTVYLEPDLYNALKVRAAETDQSLSGLVSGAVRRSLLEDAKDLAVFKRRAREPNLAFETVPKDLRRRGRV
ncbi:MAG: CopG family transcriptional regulator [Bacillati bacterium ANGP1]|uniref:CopG family transcriptional regulator n=1 Tax=Candidatus Segetimicrobium genomatis TaxID=2569760 RepID=A0A537K0I3_9BACT|nr:MAG: CopG family transcriptional regulator [Terrabacteria group bacterium ANGP1]